MSALKFAICDSRVTRANRKDVDAFVELATISSARKLKPVEAKRLARLQARLMRTGVVVLLTRQLVTRQAKAIYNALPWWKKLLLRARYAFSRTRNRMRDRFALTKLWLRS